MRRCRAGRSPVIGTAGRLGCADALADDVPDDHDPVEPMLPDAYLVTRSDRLRRFRTLAVHTNMPCLARRGGGRAGFRDPDRPYPAIDACAFHAHMLKPYADHVAETSGAAVCMRLRALAFLTEAPLGSRVVVRAHDGTGARDALGELVARGEDGVTVSTRRGSVEILFSAVIAARAVPPAPAHRR